MKKERELTQSELITKDKEMGLWCKKQLKRLEAHEKTSDICNLLANSDKEPPDLPVVKRRSKEQYLKLIELIRKS